MAESELEEELSWEDIQRLSCAFVICILGTAAHKGVQINFIFENRIIKQFFFERERTFLKFFFQDQFFGRSCFFWLFWDVLFGGWLTKLKIFINQ